MGRFLLIFLLFLVIAGCAGGQSNSLIINEDKIIPASKDYRFSKGEQIHILDITNPTLEDDERTVSEIHFGTKNGVPYKFGKSGDLIWGRVANSPTPDESLEDGWRIECAEHPKKNKRYCQVIKIKEVDGETYLPFGLRFSNPNREYICIKKMKLSMKKFREIEVDDHFRRSTRMGCFRSKRAKGIITEIKKGNFIKTKIYKPKVFSGKILKFEISTYGFAEALDLAKWLHQNEAK